MKIHRGFTLIEMMVAISLFVVVALIVSIALINVSTVNRENAAVRLALENIGLVFDTIGPAIWDAQPGGTLVSACTCENDSGSLQFNVYSTGNTIRLFKNGSAILYDDGTGSGSIPLTTADIQISKLRFSVYNTGTSLFPRVRIYIEGSVPVRGGSRTISLQSTFTTFRAI